MNDHRTLGRLAPLLAAAAGLGYAVEGAIVARAPQPESHWHTSGYVVEIAFAIALIATIPLPALLRTTRSRIGRGSALATQLGFAAMLVSSIASIGAGETVLGPAFLLGVLTSLAGLLGLTLTAARARAAGWWTAPLALGGLVLSMVLGNQGGGLLFGLAWIGISIAFRNRAEQHIPVTAHA